MRRLTKELLLDCSTAEEFRFALRCAECGRKWESSPVRFSKASIAPDTEGRRVIFRTLYERERAEACSRAAAELSRSFNLCPICGRLVCDACFLICDDLDLCTACARRLQIQGELVLEMENPVEQQ